MEVRQCGGSGVVAWDGGSMTLMGAKTTVHHNCTNGDSNNVFGLAVVCANSKIQLVHPLTKESVATDNQGGGDWGATNQDGYIFFWDAIQTIPAE